MDAALAAWNTLAMISHQKNTNHDFVLNWTLFNPSIHPPFIHPRYQISSIYFRARYLSICTHIPHGISRPSQGSQSFVTKSTDVPRASAPGSPSFGKRNATPV
ncbi:hypothetical protein EYC84_008542 [Monilinia fructicola]|uniref:Uncharacterized protein n=1 Tax=Monilinia fructicola TaxID=38448 RepID=A0A5M9JIF9_MONFR|nr:hypothetical protein EYC84_008542 [Monilinia fructicola]